MRIHLALGAVVLSVGLAGGLVGLGGVAVAQAPATGPDSAACVQAKGATTKAQTLVDANTKLQGLVKQQGELKTAQQKVKQFAPQVDVDNVGEIQGEIDLLEKALADPKTNPADKPLGQARLVLYKDLLAKLKAFPGKQAVQDARAAFLAAGGQDDLNRLERNGNIPALQTAQDKACAPTSTTTPPPPAIKQTSFGAGTYQVGRDIAAGLYRTPGSTDSSGCYWARLKSNSGGFDAIIANDFFQGPSSVTVAASDAFMEFSGSCVWTLDGATPTVPGAPAAPAKTDIKDAAAADNAVADPTTTENTGTGSGSGADADYSQVDQAPIGGVETGEL